LTPFDVTHIQGRVWASLAKSFESGRLKGTYLFYGPDGVGRWALAVAVAALLNCHRPRRGGDDRSCLAPCGACRHCRLIAGLNFEGLDFAVPIEPHKKFEDAIELTAEVVDIKRTEPFAILVSSASTTIPIDIARDISRKLSMKASVGVARVVLFYQMEKMLASSADALLKLIEEPPQDTVIILMARRPESLLPTIQSRARRIRLQRAPEPAIADYLERNYGVAPKQAKLLSRLTDGCVGRAIGMIESPDQEDTPMRPVAFLLFKSLLTEAAPEVISRIVGFVGSRDRGQAESLLALWQSLVRDCSSYAVRGNDQTLINIDFLPEIQKLSVKFADPQAAARIMDNIKITLADFQRNVHIHGALTALVLRLKSGMAGGARY
jgi:DNA polymerase-3 subunit delta'